MSLLTVSGIAVEEMSGALLFTAGAMIDTDGRGPLHGDPDAQADTSLHLDGRALNADIDRYIVLPPEIIVAVPGIVLGCQVFVINALTHQMTRAVVGDVGPRGKLGEMSVACAQAIGIDPSPTTGGESRHVITYHVWPGIPARVEGTVYRLQAYR